MAGLSIRACLRCHKKKVRCTGYPDCRSCRDCNITCEPYNRPRKGETLQVFKEAERRLQWLEDEISRECNVDCRALRTGTSLRAALHASSATNNPAAPPSIYQGLPGVEDATPSTGTASSLHAEDQGNAAAGNEAPEISMLALNATGELKYLGPSSGAFFASYAAALLRFCAPVHGTSRQSFGVHSGSSNEAGDRSAWLTDEHRNLSPEEVQLLLKSYQMWVHSLYPLLREDFLEELVARCSPHQATSSVELKKNNSTPHEMTIFYLVMVLGAANRVNTVKQLRLNFEGGAASPPSTTYLYSKALQHFDVSVENLQPKTSFIQVVLLICIYSSYGSTGSSQWQLAGLAMRMAVEIGLHYNHKDWQASERETDERSRIFWTAYAIEVSLAYNLGRPPSIGEEHITNGLPKSSDESSSGIHHIKHRQIQSRVVSQVYCGTSRVHSMPQEHRIKVISALQTELDDWRAMIPSLCCPPHAPLPYPQSYWDRLYHGTSFVLHRTSPLCPHPSIESLERCIRSAGAYIDSMADVLRTSNVPLSWMLVQGVLFAGLTMLVTARTGFRKLASRKGLTLLLVDFPNWTRKCSVCLAIMNERWQEDLLPELETHFEAIADNTIHIISSGLTSGMMKDKHNSDDHLPTPSAGAVPTQDGQMQIDALPDMARQLPDSGLFGNWEGMDLFRDFLGIEGAQTFWDWSPPEPCTNGNFQSVPLSQDESQAGSFNEIGNVFNQW